MRSNLLILGGTVEASALAKRVAGDGVNAVMSLAGRVENPKPQPIPVREGGFGGADGFARFISAQGFTHVIDATHPFAAQMSRNAVEGCATAGVPLVALTRQPWVTQAGDNWRYVDSIESAADALSGQSRRVMLAIGRMHLDAFAGNPQHFYLLRLVDKPTEPLSFPDCEVIVDRGPFGFDNDLALLRDHQIDVIVSKNSGGSGARAKIDAARALGIEVIMIQRPAVPARTEVHSVGEVMDWIASHDTDRGV